MLATEEMARYCFDVVKAKLNKLPVPAPPPTIPNDNSPLFVCFKTVDGDLRGCIGNFGAHPLHEQLRNYAQAAAFTDSRFSPISEKELPKLKCTVSLLHSFEPITSWNDWVIGVHGIQIAFSGKHGTFLPSVAPEQGWDHITTMKHLVRKAGYNGSVDEALLQQIQVTRYQESSAYVKFA